MDILMHDANGIPSPPLREAQVKVVEYIDNTFHHILEDIQIRPCGRPSIVLKRITDVKSRDQDGGLEVADREMKISFPGKNKEEAWRFTCVGKILSEIRSAIGTGEVVTKRDIYYRDPELFRSQNFVDRYVDIIAYTCGVTRLDLNVATFKSLVESQFWLGNEAIGKGLVITGKGYPDLATQRFLRACADQEADHSLTMHSRRPFVLGLFDCDPDGVKILDVYRNGSKNLAHERAYHVPDMRWIGLKPKDVFTEELNNSATLPLTVRDISKIKSMLISDTESSLDTGLGPESRSALQWMRMLNRKAEIQILEDMPGGMQEWLMNQIEAHLRELS